ncbi:MAG: hypothetical protein KDD64_03845 [Bdellovibrionales bacterium]|nr:hypothetical protein [Bdellovibrionales bacterium]
MCHRDRLLSAPYALRLQEFLFHFLNQRDPGLLIVRDHLCDDVEQCIATSASFVKIANRRELWSVLKSNLSALIRITPFLDSALVSDLKQCAVRSGALQIVAENSGAVVTLEYDPSESLILLLVSANQLEAVCQRFSIQEYVGLVEHL